MRAYAGEDPLLRREHRWVHVRLIGWVLVGSWQVLSLLAEFWPVDVQSHGIRVAGRILSLAGLIFVAYGFEKFVETVHARTRAHA